MPDPATQVYDFPPPVKPKEIRLVLPEEEGLLNIRNGVVEHGEQSQDIALASRESELNELELALIEREEAVKKAEVGLTERERNLWELEALILAREKLVFAQQQQLELDKKQLQEKEEAAKSIEANNEQMKELHDLRDEITMEQESLELAKSELEEREKFVEISEERLLEKTMLQQEEESRLEQMKEDLDARELRVNEMEGKPPPPPVEKEVL